MSVARRPRCYLLVQGIRVAVLEASVRVSRRQSADTFYCKLPLDNAAGFDEGFWSDTAPIPAEVIGTNDIGSGGFTTLLTGQVDKVQISLHDRVVSIEGRDLTASLTDSSTSEKFPNQSPQQVIETLAGRAGLSLRFTDAETAPADSDDKAGLKYDQDFSLTSDLDNYWNIIVFIARKLGCIAFIKGQELFVQPIDADTEGTFAVNYQRPLPGINADSNAVMLQCSRDLNLAKTVSVEHQSWQQKQGKTIKSKFETKGKNSDKAAILRFRGANLTKGQQDRVAKSRLKETMIHERQIAIDLPGDVTIDARNAMDLTGTGTGFDQSYFISDIVHRFDFGGGYQMTVSAHNADAKRGEPTQVE